MQGSVVRSWLCELAARAFEQEGNDLGGPQAPTSTDSGEGRWTIEDAIEQGRAHAGDHGLAVRPLLLRAGRATSPDGCSRALRNQFGGHAVEREPVAS